MKAIGGARADGGLSAPRGLGLRGGTVGASKRGVRSRLRIDARKRRSLVVTLGLAWCLAVSGCGGGDDGDASSARTSAPAPPPTAGGATDAAPASAPTGSAPRSLPYGVDSDVVSSADQAFVAGLRARIEDDFASCGQGGGGRYLAWQTPGVLQILVDTERKYYQHPVDDMLNRASFNRPDRFDLAVGAVDVARPAEAIAQLAWEEHICAGIGNDACMFDRDASGDTDLRQLKVAGVDATDALNHDPVLGLQAVINDDRLWWALGLLSVYTANPFGHANLLDYSREIQAAVSRYRAPDGVGVCWKMVGKYTLNGCYENTITNSLYVDVLTRLAEVAKAQGDEASRGQYVDEARRVADLVVFAGAATNPSTGMLADGLQGGGGGDLRDYYTYNQGVVLEGLARLATETGDAKYLVAAKGLVRSAILHHTGFADGSPNDGIFREFVADNGDNGFFKAAYFQYLANFLERIDLVEDPDFTGLVYAFLKRNAESVKAAPNYEIPNDYASGASGGSTPATRAAALVLKTTYLRLRTFVWRSRDALPFGVDDARVYW